MQSKSWKQIREEVAATFDQNRIHYDERYLISYQRKISKQMTTEQKATWKKHSRALLKEGIQPVLVDTILDEAFEPKALAATAGR